MNELHSLIKHRYPDTHIINFNDKSLQCKNYKHQMRLLNNLRTNDNTFITIERASNIKFNKFAIELSGEYGDEIDVSIANNLCLIIIRGKKVALLDAEQYEIPSILKHLFHDISHECGLCCNDFTSDNAEFKCYHCKSSMCGTCAQRLFDTTSFWCPYCQTHLLFPEISRPYECHDELDSTLNQLMDGFTKVGKLNMNTVKLGKLPTDTLHLLSELGARINSYVDLDYMISRSIIKHHNIPVCI